jgi:hypothetical protein
MIEKQYTSLAAYLAHWQALRHDPAVSKNPLLSEMNRAITEILGAEQRYLLDEPADSAARRRRDRVEIRLRHELIERGVIAE